MSAEVVRIVGPVQPITAQLLDGKEYRFLLAAGAVMRAQVRLGLKNAEELGQASAISYFAAALYESLWPRSIRQATDFEDFTDILTANKDDLEKLFVKVAENSTGRPTPAAPPINGAAADSPSLTSGPSGPRSSDEPETNTTN